MKMKKSVLSTAIAGALLATSSVSIAQNTGPSPELTLPEKAAFTLIEQAHSLMAAVIDRQGCAATAGNYTLGGDVDFAGTGAATIDDTTINVVAPLDTFRGTATLTSLAAPGEIDDMDFLDLAGEFWYSGEGEILWARADFGLCVENCPTSREAYDEHVIKDFFRDVTSPRRLVLDQGLEVITKNNWPRKKYRQISRYVPPNGGIGAVVIGKISIAPNNAPQCAIDYVAQVDDFGGGIQFAGTMTVGLAP